MTNYRIHNQTSGAVIGTYAAHSPDGALEAMARDAGYADYAAACAVAPGDDLVVTELEQPPEVAYRLRLVARVTIAGSEYVVYSDSEYTWAVPASDYDRTTAQSDYSEWASDTESVEDEQLCALIAARAGLAGIYAAGVSTWVDAAKTTVASEDEYIALVGSKRGAHAFENAALSIGSAYLPPCAVRVRDDEGDDDGEDATPQYWSWLADQFCGYADEDADED